MTTGYIVAWTGGYDAPQYEYRGTRVEAFNLAAEYLRDFDPERDSIDVLAIDTDAQTIERIEAGTCPQCAKRVVRDDEGTLIDLDTGGDVCGALGGNEPHTEGTVITIAVALCDFVLDPEGMGVSCDAPAPHCIGGESYYCDEHIDIINNERTQP